MNISQEQIDHIASAMEQECQKDGASSIIRFDLLRPLLPSIISAYLETISSQVIDGDNIKGDERCNAQALTKE